MLKLTVRRDRIGPILNRHPWIFSGAFKHIPEGIKSGEPTIVYDEDDRFLAQGYFNSYSQIAVRLWSWDEREEINQDFFNKKIKDALEIRKNYVLDKKTNSCRLVNAENDFLPGLVIDKYGDYLCLQCHTPGIERWKKEILSALVKILKPKGIYERSDVRVREIEKANAQTSLLYGKVPDRIKILENGFIFLTDIIHGQKTGFFLDQRDKRQALMKYADGKKVLNCFSYTGGFSVYALAGGAKQVVSVDVSESALDLAKENIKLNGLNVKKCEFVCEDVKNYLNKEELKNIFDIILLDPPAFIKDRRKIQEGIFGYKKINEAAMRLLPPGGILVSASCSTHLSLPDFRFMLAQSAGRAGRTLQILETFTHGADHPSIVAFNEGEYLKCVFARVL